MKTRELATEIFLRATDRMRPGMRDKDMKPIIDSSIKWARDANGAFDAAFPADRAVVADPAEPAPVRPDRPRVASAAISREPSTPAADGSGVVPPGRIGG